jgi:chromosome segregation ATPase
MQDEAQHNTQDNSSSSIRIDAAHRLSSRNDTLAGDIQPALIPAGMAAEGMTAENTAEQVRVHATQLALHLQERRREVDHRESHLNARIAQLENDLRNSRLWLQERSEEFSLREAELAQRIAEHEARLRGLSASETALNDIEQQQALKLQHREEQLRQREDQLAQAQLQLEVQQSSISRRMDQLADQERLLEEQLRQLHEERRVVQRESDTSQEELAQQRQTLSEQREQLDQQEADQRRTWEARSAHFDERQIALERIRNDIVRLHREALEMRLVAEQLWSQMAGHVQPGELTEGIARLRAQLADEFRFARQEIVTQRTSLEALIGKLDGQRCELAAQRDELVGWLNRRQQELALQSAELAEREQKWLQERQQADRQEKSWQSERRELQRQIRQLTMRLRQAELVAA